MALNQEFERFARRAYHMSGDTLLVKIEKGESGGSGTAVSKAGARGWFQFMPATRQAVLQYTGGRIDPWRSEGEARQAAMLHLLGKLGNRRGLSGYNPGDPSYPRYILNQQVPGQPSGTTGGSSGPSATTTRTTTRTTPGVDRSGERKALILNWLQTKNQPGSLIQLASGLQGAQDTPDRTVRTTQEGGSVAAGSGRYVNPFGGSLKAPGRVDEGVDPTIQGPIRAIGDAKVVNLSHNFYKGQPYLVYQLTSGPKAGHYVYVSELVTPHVKVGDRVKAGDVIATGHGAIETGWAGGAQGSYLPLANRAQGGNYTEGMATGHGASFAALLKRLGANAAR